VKAVVLVGGEGTRLQPLTFTTPKQMLPVAGRPMIERVVAHLAGHGIDQVVLSLGYRPAAFLTAYPDGHCAGVELLYAVEPEPLDTAGAIGFAARFAGIDDTFVVVNGDVLTGLDVGAVIAFHRQRQAEATIALTPVDDPSRYGVVCTDPDGLVTAFIEKPPAGEAPTNLINAGTYVVEPSVLERVPAGRRVSIERETFPALVERGRLYAMASDADWIDAGTPATYLSVSLAMAEREGGGIAAGARVHRRAQVVDSVVEAGAVIDEDAVVHGSLVFSGARVGPEARVRGSILGHDSVIGKGARVEELSVIGDGGVVADGEALAGARRSDGAA
jgi:mannose-1-phosphate guanylyltransferase